MLVLNASHANIPTPEGANEDGWQIQICYTAEGMAALLLNYDPVSGTSPADTNAQMNHLYLSIMQSVLKT